MEHLGAVREHQWAVMEYIWGSKGTTGVVREQSEGSKVLCWGSKGVFRGCKGVAWVSSFAHSPT